VIAVDPAQLHPLALDRGNIHHLCMKAEDAVPEVNRLLHGGLVSGLYEIMKMVII
jgi:hypothetical protein